MTHQTRYPMGSVSTGTMRAEDLIPSFLRELRYQMRRRRIKGHAALARGIERRMQAANYYESDDSDYDLDSLFDALSEYAGPHFYFGAHPGDGSDYGYWLAEEWDADFVDATHNGAPALRNPYLGEDYPGCGIRVNDLREVPKWFRGEVAHVNDHGNVTLYVKSARRLREVWAIV